MTSSTSAASRTVRVMGPTWDTRAKPLGNPRPSGTRPYDGLKPYTPQNAAGMRIEPPPSLPSASGPQPLDSHRSEEHTSEIQAPCKSLCRLLLGKKKKPI